MRARSRRDAACDGAAADMPPLHRGGGDGPAADSFSPSTFYNHRAPDKAHGTASQLFSPAPHAATTATTMTPVRLYESSPGTSPADVFSISAAGLTPLGTVRDVVPPPSLVFRALPPPPPPASAPAVVAVEPTRGEGAVDDVAARHCYICEGNVVMRGSAAERRARWDAHLSTALHRRLTQERATAVNHSRPSRQRIVVHRGEERAVAADTGRPREEGQERDKGRRRRGARGRRRLPSSHEEHSTGGNASDEEEETMAGSLTYSDSSDGASPPLSTAPTRGAVAPTPTFPHESLQRAASSLPRPHDISVLSITNETPLADHRTVPNVVAPQGGEDGPVGVPAQVAVLPPDELRRLLREDAARRERRRAEKALQAAQFRQELALMQRCMHHWYNAMFARAIARRSPVQDEDEEEEEGERDDRSPGPRRHRHRSRRHRRTPQDREDQRHDTAVCPPPQKRSGEALPPPPVSRVTSDSTHGTRRSANGKLARQPSREPQDGAPGQPHRQQHASAALPHDRDRASHRGGDCTLWLSTRQKGYAKVRLVGGVVVPVVASEDRRGRRGCRGAALPTDGTIRDVEDDTRELEVEDVRVDWHVSRGRGASGPSKRTSVSSRFRPRQSRLEPYRSSPASRRPYRDDFASEEENSNRAAPRAHSPAAPPHPHPGGSPTRQHRTAEAGAHPDAPGRRPRRRRPTSSRRAQTSFESVEDHITGAAFATRSDRSGSGASRAARDSSNAFPPSGATAAPAPRGREVESDVLVDIMTGTQPNREGPVSTFSTNRSIPKDERHPHPRGHRATSGAEDASDSSDHTMTTRSSSASSPVHAAQEERGVLCVGNDAHSPFDEAEVAGRSGGSRAAGDADPSPPAARRHRRSSPTGYRTPRGGGHPAHAPAASPPSSSAHEGSSIRFQEGSSSDGESRDAVRDRQRRRRHDNLRGSSRSTASSSSASESAAEKRPGSHRRGVAAAATHTRWPRRAREAASEGHEQDDSEAYEDMSTLVDPEDDGTSSTSGFARPEGHKPRDRQRATVPLHRTDASGWSSDSDVAAVMARLSPARRARVRGMLHATPSLSASSRRGKKGGERGPLGRHPDQGRGTAGARESGRGAAPHPLRERRTADGHGPAAKGRGRERAAPGPTPFPFTAKVLERLQSPARPVGGYPRAAPACTPASSSDESPVCPSSGAPAAPTASHAPPPAPHPSRLEPVVGTFPDGGRRVLYVDPVTGLLDADASGAPPVSAAANPAGHALHPPHAQPAHSGLASSPQQLPSQSAFSPDTALSLAPSAPSPVLSPGIGPLRASVSQHTVPARWRHRPQEAADPMGYFRSLREPPLLLHSASGPIAASRTPAAAAAGRPVWRSTEVDEGWEGGSHTSPQEQSLPMSDARRPTNAFFDRDEALAAIVCAQQRPTERDAPRGEHPQTDAAVREEKGGLEDTAAPDSVCQSAENGREMSDPLVHEVGAMGSSRSGRDELARLPPGSHRDGLCGRHPVQARAPSSSSTSLSDSEKAATGWRRRAGAVGGRYEDSSDGCAHRRGVRPRPHGGREETDAVAAQSLDGSWADAMHRRRRGKSPHHSLHRGGRPRGHSNGSRHHRHHRRHRRQPHSGSRDADGGRPPEGTRRESTHEDARRDGYGSDPSGRADVPPLSHREGPQGRREGDVGATDGREDREGCGSARTLLDGCPHMVPDAADSEGVAGAARDGMTEDVSSLLQSRPEAGRTGQDTTDPYDSPPRPSHVAFPEQQEALCDALGASPPQEIPSTARGAPEAATPSPVEDPQAAAPFRPDNNSLTTPADSTPSASFAAVRGFTPPAPHEGGEGPATGGSRSSSQLPLMGEPGTVYVFRDGAFRRVPDLSAAAMHNHHGEPIFVVATRPPVGRTDPSPSVKGGGGEADDGSSRPLTTPTSSTQGRLSGEQRPCTPSGAAGATSPRESHRRRSSDDRRHAPDPFVAAAGPSCTPPLTGGTTTPSGSSRAALHADVAATRSSHGPQSRPGNGNDRGAPMPSHSSRSRSAHAPAAGIGPPCNDGLASWRRGPSPRRPLTASSSPVGCGRLNPYCSVCRAKFNLIFVDERMRPVRWPSPRAPGLQQLGDCRYRDGYVFGGPTATPLVPVRVHSPPGGVWQRSPSRPPSTPQDPPQRLRGGDASSQQRHTPVSRPTARSPSLAQPATTTTTTTTASAATLSARGAFVPARFRRVTAVASATTQYACDHPSAREPSAQRSPVPSPRAPIHPAAEPNRGATDATSGSTEVARADEAARRQQRREERRLRKRMKQLLWRDPPDERDGDAWNAYLSSLTEGLDLFEALVAGQTRSQS